MGSDKPHDKPICWCCLQEIAAAEVVDLGVLGSACRDCWLRILPGEQLRIIAEATRIGLVNPLVEEATKFVHQVRERMNEIPDDFEDDDEGGNSPFRPRKPGPFPWAGRG